MGLPVFILMALMLSGISAQDGNAKPNITADFFWWLFPPYYSSACSGIRQCQYVAESRICAYDTVRGWRSFRNLCTLNQYNLCYGYSFVQNSTGYCLSAIG